MGAITPVEFLRLYLKARMFRILENFLLPQVRTDGYFEGDSPSCSFAPGAG
jgi:hypothetical protein